MTPSQFDIWLTQPSRRPLVMGVLNITPDSFSDGGRFESPEAAIAHAEALAGEGADLIDVGGESTRPGSLPVSADEQIRRVVPVLRGVAHRLPVVFSIDTTRSSVAAAAIDAGAYVVNDVSAARDDPQLLPLVARRGVGIILMHMLGTPATMQQSPSYADVAADVSAFLRERIDAATVSGVDPARILVDPGIGFGKNTRHNLELLARLTELVELGRPVVVGTSRKRFIGEITGDPDPAQKLFGTAATVAWSVANGAAMVRVHDVGPMRRVVQMIEAIAGARRPAG